MKMTITFEFQDLLDTITKMLAMNGTVPLTDAAGNPCIVFNFKKKEITVHCEAAPLPTSCLFCGSSVGLETPTQHDDSKTQTTENKNSQTNNDSQANTGEQAENEPMSLAQLRAQSGALARREGPIKHNVQRGAEAHAALARPSLMEGESTRNPFEDESGD